jgi:hypothetical protein
MDDDEHNLTPTAHHGSCADIPPVGSGQGPDGLARVQRTAVEEFRPTVDPKSPGLKAQLERRRSFDNHHHRRRPHGSLGGSTPAERIAELAPQIPTPEAVHAAYHPSREVIQHQNTRCHWLPTSTRVTCSTQTLHQFPLQLGGQRSTFVPLSVGVRTGHAASSSHVLPSQA